MAGRLILSHKVVLLACLGLVSLPEFAQGGLPDPTRPPPGLSADSTAAAGADTAPVLQSVLIPKQGRPLAVIGGRTVRLGEKYGTSRLVRVREDEVVLEGPAGVERLTLHPGVEKTRITTKTTTKAPSSVRTRNGSTP